MRGGNQLLDWCALAVAKRVLKEYGVSASVPLWVVAAAAVACRSRSTRRMRFS